MKIWKLITNPFTTYNPELLILVGSICSAIAMVLAHQFMIRFDGVIDVHIAPVPSIKAALWDQFITITSLTLSLYLVSLLLINRKTRLIEIFAVALVYRIPFTLLPLFNLNNALLPPRTTQNLNELAQFANDHILQLSLFIIAIILVLIWSFILLVNGYRVVTNGKGTRFVAGVILSVLIAEVLSKLLISIIVL